MAIIKAKSVTLTNCGEFRVRFRAEWGDDTSYTDYTKRYGSGGADGKAKTIDLTGHGIAPNETVQLCVRVQGGIPNRILSAPVQYDPNGIDAYYSACGLSTDPGVSGPSTTGGC